MSVDADLVEFQTQCSTPNCFLSTLPIAFLGKLSTTRTSRGRLCTESCSATYPDQRIGIGIADYERDDALAQVVVGKPDNRGFVDTRMAEQHRLHLARADAVATGLDQVDRLATDDAVHAGAVDHGNVAGAVPAVGVECLGGGIGPVQVAVEYRRRLNL